MRSWRRSDETDNSSEVSNRLAGRILLVTLAGLSVAVATATLWWAGPAASGGAGSETLSDPEESRAAAISGSLGLWFEPNDGQAPDQVAFQAKGLGYGVFLTRQAGATLVLSEEDSLRINLLASNPQPEVAGADQLSSVSNYLIGNDRNAWRAGLPHYARVQYEEIYPGIDLAFYGSQGHLEYDFIVEPAADPSQIRVSFTGAREVAVAPNGDLVITMDAGEVRQKAPVIYQQSGSSRQTVDGSFRVLSQADSESVVGFELGPYTPNLPLVIDPKIDYSTFLGGDNGDRARDLAVDSSGSVYLIGQTFSPNFPTQSAMQSTFGGASDVLVAKFSPDGAALAYATYIGGTGGESGKGIAIDDAGLPYLTGTTGSANFPTLSAYQAVYGGSFHDCFVAKLNASGSAFLFSTFWGGTGADHSEGIDLDTHGNPYVAGYTGSADFPTKSAIQGEKGGLTSYDAFASKFNSVGNSVYYSTYLGGKGNDRARDVAVDSSGNAYVAGYTDSTDFPTRSAVQGSRAGAYDAFLIRLSNTGSQLFATYFGGSSSDFGTSVEVDSSGRPYLSGHTDSANFPTSNAYQATLAGMYDSFVAKFQSSGSVTYSTFFGGSATDLSRGIFVDQDSQSHVVGQTDSTDFPMRTPMQGSAGGGGDAFLFTLDASGSGLVLSSYLGGSAGDWASGIAVDANQSIYIAGETHSSDFPTRNAIQPTKMADVDLFLTKLENKALDFFVAGTPARIETVSTAPSEH